MQLKKIFIIVLASLFVSCSSKNSIVTYMANEIKNNKTNNIQSILVDKKRHVSHTLDIYKGINIHKINSQAKSFSQDDYELLSKLYENDTISEYWNEKHSKSFHFKKLITTKEISNYPLSNSNDSITYLYNLSKPIFIKKKKHALFSVMVSRGMRMIMDDYVIIMRKEKGKWVFLEKVYSTDLH